MSFMGGAECSTAGNPLSQFAKHTQDDRSLQRDRMVNGGPQGSMGGFRTIGQHGPQDEVSVTASTARLIQPPTNAQLRRC